MMATLATLLLAIAILIVAVALLAVRSLLIPGGEFRGTCASNNPYLPELRNEAGECWACGKKDAAEIEACEHRDGPHRILSRLFGRFRRFR